MSTALTTDVGQQQPPAVASSVLLADVVSYINDQSKQFLQCAGHHAEHNRGAEAVAIRASEILDRIAADIKSANEKVSHEAGGKEHQ